MRSRLTFRRWPPPSGPAGGGGDDELLHAADQNPGSRRHYAARGRFDRGVPPVVRYRSNTEKRFSSRCTLYTTRECERPAASSAPFLSVSYCGPLIPGWQITLHSRKIRPSAAEEMSASALPSLSSRDSLHVTRFLVGVSSSSPIHKYRNISLHCAQSLLEGLATCHPIPGEGVLHLLIDT
jgi:hypothetical protein